MWESRVKVTVEVSAKGLWRITEELYGYELLSLRCRAINLKVTPRSNGTFMVHLTHDQTKTLLSRLPHQSLQKEYGEEL